MDTATVMEDMAPATGMVIIVILIATATITTVMDILLGINSLAVTGMTIVVDQVTIPVIGDETTGQGDSL